MSKRIGAKGRRQSEIEEDEWYANYMNELRAEEYCQMARKRIAAVPVSLSRFM